MSGLMVYHIPKKNIPISIGNGKIKLINMPRGKSSPELYLALFIGKKPTELIAKGYSKHTVYAYNRRFPQIKKALEEKVLK